MSESALAEFQLVAPRVKATRTPTVREAPAFLHGAPARIIHGNCLHPKTGVAMLPDKSVDHMITDAPFGKHTHKNPRPTVKGNSLAAKRSLDFNACTPALRKGIVREAKRLVTGWTVIFSDTESSHLWREAAHRVGLEYVRTLPWIHRGGTPQKTGDRPAQAHEDVLFFHGGGRKQWFGNFASNPYIYETPVLRGSDGEPRHHQAQKPLALMERIVLDVSQRGDLILDCCAGVCTTLVAAVANGRYAIGWERRKQDVQIGGRRLAGSKEQLVFAPILAPDPIAPVGENESQSR